MAISSLFTQRKQEISMASRADATELKTPAIPRVYWLCIGSAAVFYVFLAMHQPYSILVWQGFDDMLFIEHARSLAEGSWLGQFSELTLIKGPGYPFFLAINYWLGLPVSFTQALFHCGSLCALSVLVLRMSRSKVLAILTFVLPLLDPRVNEDNHIIRDSIYAGQATLVLAVFSHALFQARTRNAQRNAAACAGLLTGWFWLTREEGIWMVPSLLFVVLFASLRKKHGENQAPILVPTIIAAGCFSMVLIAFATANLVVYKKFTGVDVGEKNFRGALSAMESVRMGERIPYVAVPRPVRAELYAVSPSFGELKKYLDPDGSSSPFASADCSHHASTCGDLSNGFFMWALRDAAGKAGYYASPKKASEFFGRIANEISAACESARLTCVHNWVPYMPPVTAEQIRGAPASFTSAWKSMSSSANSQLTTHWKILGEENTFQSALAFLNYPEHFSMTGKPVDVEVQGWYYHKARGDEWPNIVVADNVSDNVPFEIKRLESPDVARVLGDASASQQRFRIKAKCSDNCRIAFSNSDSIRFVVPLNTSQKSFDQGGAKLVLDVINAGPNGRLLTDVRNRFVHMVVELLNKAYSMMKPPLLAIGFMAFLSVCFLAFRNADYPEILVLAGACWIAVATRTVILVLVDISSFSGITDNYMQPVFLFSVVASILSIFSLTKMTLLQEPALRPR